MTWKTVNLCGAVSISRVCGVYEIQQLTKIPGGKFKIKVLERAEDFVAYPNICLRGRDGTPRWISGLGQTDVEALEDALRWFMAELAKRDHWEPDDFEWSDSRDF